MIHDILQQTFETLRRMHAFRGLRFDQISIVRTNLRSLFPAMRLCRYISKHLAHLICKFAVVRLSSAVEELHQAAELVLGASSEALQPVVPDVEIMRLHSQLLKGMGQKLLPLLKRLGKHVCKLAAVAAIPSVAFDARKLELKRVVCCGQHVTTPGYCAQKWILLLLAPCPATSP